MEYGDEPSIASEHRTDRSLHEHALVAIVLAACDQSDDQDEIGTLVDDLVRRRHPTQELPAGAAFRSAAAFVRETCSRAA